MLKKDMTDTRIIFSLISYESFRLQFTLILILLGGFSG